jgi:hypothetical protein
VQKASEYLQHAAECRAFAARATSPEHRDMLLRMAATWDSLATDRDGRLEQDKRIAELDGDKTVGKLNCVVG